MKRYKYSFQDQNEITHEGVIDANSKTEAEAKVLKENSIVYKVKNLKVWEI